MTQQDSKTLDFPTEAPAGASPTTAALWPEAVKAFETMASSAKAIDDLKGTAGEILGKARKDVLETKDGKYVAMLIEKFRKAADEGEAWIAQQATETAGDKMKGADAKRKAAEAKYTEAKKDFDSALTFLSRDKKVAKILATVTVPTVKRSSSGGSGPRANTSGLSYWRQPKGGAKEYQGQAQNQASSLAWYYAGCLSDSKNGNMGALVQYASAKGVNVKGSDPWEIELPNGTVIGADKVTE